MHEGFPDHPVIQNLLRTGQPDGKEPDYPRCPVCGEEAEHFYYSSKRREYVGCEICLTARDAWDSWGG